MVHDGREFEPVPGDFPVTVRASITDDEVVEWVLRVGTDRVVSLTVPHPYTIGPAEAFRRLLRRVIDEPVRSTQNGEDR